jgi:ammonia channel protein AmtB
LQSQITDARNAANTTWILLEGAIIFFMQTGFAFLEAGSMR